ncbi:hypothetical protein EAH81_24550 [Flavobacterium pectinovorum]|uniref:Uncharacterized protein n=1 Tax=Flavobacterium pectinovorum TaxID=29533 RepID=A0A502E8K0_9FLAO|nr:hypothetical protein EAH81_24550 [Flavobacterium pectinovorum]
MSYHSGKDGGMLTGLQMIVILSSIYFLVLSKRNKIIFLFVGFMIGVLSFLISYFVAYGFLNYDDIYCYLFAMIIFIVSFHLIERRRETWKKLKVNDINN